MARSGAICVPSLTPLPAAGGVELRHISVDPLNPDHSSHGDLLRSILQLACLTAPRVPAEPSPAAHVPPTWSLRCICSPCRPRGFTLPCVGVGIFGSIPE